MEEIFEWNVVEVFDAEGFVSVENVTIKNGNISFSSIWQGVKNRTNKKCVFQICEIPSYQAADNCDRLLECATENAANSGRRKC